MTFLIDNPLPQSLADFFIKHGFKADHVLDLRLDEGGKTQIVRVRLGNCRKQFLLAAFETALPRLIQALEQGDCVIELW